METAPVTRKPHPMILVAAASVTALSLTGIASLSGWLPVHSTAPAESPSLTAAAPAAQATPPITTAANHAPATLQIPAGATITVEQKRQAGNSPRPQARTVSEAGNEPVPASIPRPTRVSSTQTVNESGIHVERARTASMPETTEPRPAGQAAAICNDCGTIESIREIAGKGEGTGLGAVAGGVIGGLLGSQIGGGNGKKAMAVVGAAGGAYAGHEVEKRMRGEKQYEIVVRFDDGRTRTYTEMQVPQMQNGDRVRLDNGRLVML